MNRQRLWTFVSQWWWLWVPGLGVGLRLAYLLAPGHPSLLRVPLYLLFLAGLCAVFGHHYAVVLGVQVLAGGLSTVVLVMLGQRLFGKVAAPIVAGTGQQVVPPEFLRDYRPDVVIVMNPVMRTKSDSLQGASG